VHDARKLNKRDATRTVPSDSSMHKSQQESWAMAPFEILLVKMVWDRLSNDAENLSGIPDIQDS
jgi:hypothetical protein